MGVDPVLHSVQMETEGMRTGSKANTRAMMAGALFWA